MVRKTSFQDLLDASWVNEAEQPPLKAEGWHRFPRTARWVRVVAVLTGFATATGGVAAAGVNYLIGGPLDRVTDAHNKYVANFFTDRPQPKLVAEDGKIHILALGDSEMSGAGSGRDIYGDPSMDPDHGCFMSGEAPVFRLQEALGPNFSAEDDACLGRTTDEVNTQQVPNIQYDSDIVLVTIGVNNLDLENILENCLNGNVKVSCATLVNNTMTNKLGAMEISVQQTLKNIKAKVKPGATLIFAGYNRPFPEKSSLGCDPLGDDALNALNGGYVRMEGALRRAAKNAGFAYLDSNEAIRSDQAPCTKGSVFDDITPFNLAVQGTGGVYGGLYFHLNGAGNEALGNFLANYITSGAAAAAMPTPPSALAFTH